MNNDKGKSDSYAETTEMGVKDVDIDQQGGGHLVRRFTFLSCLGMAFANLNSWTAMAASLSLVLPSGGSVSMVWGLIVSALGSLAMCISLAEICHVYPVAGGQYDWTYLIAPKQYKNGLSFFVGWMAAAGWVALVATGSSLGANFITGIISLWTETFEVQRWQTFLLYLAFTIGAFCLNTFGIRLLPLVEQAAFWWSLSGIVIVCITILACQSGNYQPAHNVFAKFTNETGWPNGIAFILGLLQSTFGLTGFDAISHMIEEMPQPAINAPKVMILAVCLGASTSWVFSVILLFCLTNLDEVIQSTAGPLLQIYYQATSNRAGATALLMFNLLAMAFATEGLMTIASRMVMTFARDRGFAMLSIPLGRVHPRLQVPHWSIVFTAAWTVVFGLIYLGSSVALNAILSASVVFVQLSYFVPILIVAIRGEAAFEGQPRTYSLGKFRLPINLFALAFALLTSVCFVFPPAVPVTSTSMNYVIVVWGVVMLMMTGTWIFDARKKYNGPWELNKRLDMARKAM